MQDHVLHTAQAHIDRIVLEAFVAGIDTCEDEEPKHILEQPLATDSSSKTCDAEPSASTP